MIYTVLIFNSQEQNTLAESVAVIPAVGRILECKQKLPYLISTENGYGGENEWGTEVNLNIEK